jgi:RHS repeat-associated protein
MTRGGQTYFYTMDGLGSVRDLTSAAETIVEQYQYDSFGNLTAPPTTGNPYTYTSREYDSETGFYFYRARYYDPKVGRFISEDPIGFEGGDVNFYAYVKNDPINYTDPSGLHIVCRPPYYNCYYHLSCIDGHEHPNGDVTEGRCFDSNPPLRMGCNWQELISCIGMACDMEQIDACKTVCECPLPTCKALCIACIAGKGIEIGSCFYEHCTWEN